MACLCGGRGGGGASKCHVTLTAQLSEAPAGTPRAARSSGSATIDESAAPPPAPTSFPGLGTAVAAELRAASGAARVTVKKVTAAPAAGGLHHVRVDISAELWFSDTPAATTWQAALVPPGALQLEERLLARLDASPPAGLCSVSEVKLSAGGGTRREESSVHRARRPSTVHLRVSTGIQSLEAEIAAAPPGTFPPHPPRPEEAAAAADAPH